MIAEAPLSFGGEVSVFKGTVTIPVPGDFRLEVLAVQPETQNVGHAEVRLHVVAP